MAAACVKEEKDSPSRCCTSASCTLSCSSYATTCRLP